MGHALLPGQCHNKHALQLHCQSARCVSVHFKCGMQVQVHLLLLRSARTFVVGRWGVNLAMQGQARLSKANFRHLGFAKMLILAVSHSFFHLTISWRHSLKPSSVSICCFIGLFGAANYGKHFDSSVVSFS